MRSMIVLMCLVASGAWPPAIFGEGAKTDGALPRHLLTNEGLVLLAQAGYDEDFLIHLIHRKQTRFDTTVEGLAFLARNGISEAVVRVVLDNESKAASQAPPAALPAVAIAARLEQQAILVPAGAGPSPRPPGAGSASAAQRAKKPGHADRWYIISAPPDAAAASEPEQTHRRPESPAFIYYAYPAR